MAITGTTTSANTSTFVRMLAIKNQFKIAFQRIMDYSQKNYAPFLDAISDKKIEFISFWSYKVNNTGEKEKWCQLTMFVDWKKHQSFLLDGRNSVVLKKSWDGILPEVGAAIDMFAEITAEYSLIPTFSVQFVSDISTSDYSYYMNKLNLVPGTTVKWKSGLDTSNMTSLLKKYPEELQELSIEVLVSNDL